jgi:hypothetical protein
MLEWIKRLMTSATPDSFPFECDEIKVVWRRSHWHVFAQYKTSREDREDPWAYGSLGIHVFPGDPEDPGDLAAALRGAIRTVVQKTRRSGVTWTSPAIVYSGQDGYEVLAAVRTVAAGLGWPHVTSSQH